MNHFSSVGYIVGVVLIGAFVVLPLAFMGLKSKNVFKRSTIALPH